MKNIQTMHLPRSLITPHHFRHPCPVTVYGRVVCSSARITAGIEEKNIRLSDAHVAGRRSNQAGHCVCFRRAKRD